MNTAQKQQAGQQARQLLDKGHKLSDRVYVLYLPDTNEYAEENIAGLSDPISHEDHKYMQTPLVYHKLGDLAHAW